MGAQRRLLVVLLVEQAADGLQPEPQLAQQEDPLQPHERVVVVPAVAVGADPRRRQQPDVVVVAQRAARGACQPGHLLDRCLHACDGRG